MARESLIGILAIVIALHSLEHRRFQASHNLWHSAFSCRQFACKWEPRTGWSCMNRTMVTMPDLSRHWTPWVDSTGICDPYDQRRLSEAAELKWEWAKPERMRE